MKKTKDTKKAAGRVVVIGRTPLTVRDIINELARTEDRTFSNMVSHLLMESPRVRERLEQLGQSV